MGEFLKRLRRKPTEQRGYVSYGDYMSQFTEPKTRAAFRPPPDLVHLSACYRRERIS